MGPDVKQEDLDWWKAAFAKLQSSEEFQQYLHDRDVLPLNVTGQALNDLVKKQIEDYRKLGKEFGLVAE